MSEDLTKTKKLSDDAWKPKKPEQILIIDKFDTCKCVIISHLNRKWIWNDKKGRWILEKKADVEKGHILYKKCKRHTTVNGAKEYNKLKGNILTEAEKKILKEST